MNSSSKGTGLWAIRSRKSFTKFATSFTAALLLVYPVFAASPASGEISPTSKPLSFTGTATGTGAANGESTCVEGVTCDTYTLTVSGSDWSKAVLQVQLAWGVAANDRDLYIHKGDLNGPVIASSGGGAPQTGEAAVIDPQTTGTGTYSVHVVYFACTPNQDQPVGTITPIARPATRTAIWVNGGIGFSPMYPTKCPVSNADGEPSSRTDYLGNHYVAGIRGVPAGVDLWWFDLRPNSPTFDPYMRNPIYRGQPDSFLPSQAVSVGADGGGDVDIAVGMGASGPNNVPTLAFTSLAAANVSSSRSQDLGNSFSKNPAGNASGGIPVDDRQWLQFFGPNQVYLTYRTFQPAIAQVQVSTDGGLTYGPTTNVGQIGQLGSIDVDQGDGTVYVAGSSGQIAIGTPDPILGYPTSYTLVQAANDPNGEGNLFFIVRVGANHTVYACYSNGSHIFLISSKDHGQHWTSPLRVDNTLASRTSIFPAMATGPTPGSLAISWYGTTDTVNDDNALWNVFVAQTFNADDAIPTFRQAFVSDHYIHGGNISLGGTLGNQNRNLLDYFQISYDPAGALVIDITDDHNDFIGHTYVCRQISGPNYRNQKLPTPQEGTDLPAVQPLSYDGSQVVDFMGDVTYGLLGVLPNPDPLDIVKIKYTSKSQPNGDIMLIGKMTLSTLASLQKQSAWRMNFSVNCPGTALNASKQYSNGVSDFGDQFFLEAQLDQTGTPVWSWGTAVRTSSGSMTYTKQGSAAGRFDFTDNSITVQVLASKLKPFCTHGPAITKGTWASGLRGQSFLESSLVKYDETRGGTVWIISG